MPLDPALLGHETQSQTGVVQAEDVRRFADAIGDSNPVFRDVAAARLAGYENIPATPTFVTRFRVDFTEAGLDVAHSQVLHGEQEYTYTRPLCVGDTLTVRHRIASLRQSARGGMAIMSLEQIIEAVDSEQVGAERSRVATGLATVIVRDAAPEAAESGSSSASASKSKAPSVPQGESITPLTKTVTQEQINAYADVSGDHNPIHINPERARAVGLDGTIAHGMLSMGFLGQLLTDWLSGRSGGWVARLRVRFQAMVRPGDTLTCQGVLGAREGDRQRIDVWIENQHGERVITGDADVIVPA